MRGHVAAWALTLAVLVSACGAPTTSPTASNQPASTGPSASSQASGPSPTRWPQTVVEAAIALAASNAGFETMTNELSVAVTAQDTKRMLVVMQNALTFLRANDPTISALQSYPATKSVGDQLAAAYAQLIDGGQKVVDGLGAGDGKAVQAGFDLFFTGSTAYANALPGLGDLAGQAALMQKGYVK